MHSLTPPETRRPSQILTIVRAMFLNELTVTSFKCVSSTSIHIDCRCDVHAHTAFVHTVPGAGVLEAWLHKLMSQVDATLGGYKILQPGANGVLINHHVREHWRTELIYAYSSFCRGGYSGPGRHTDLLGLQVGRLLGQIRSRLPALRQQRRRALQRPDSTFAGRERRVCCCASVPLVCTRICRSCLLALLLVILCSNMQYIDRDGHEYLYTLNVFADSLQKKVTLLKYFRGYMAEHLLKAGQNIPTQQQDPQEMTRMPFLRCWFRTRNAIVLHLSNGTLQVSTTDAAAIAV